MHINQLESGIEQSDLQQANKDIAQSLILLTPAIVTAPTMDTEGARAWAHPKMVKVGELLALNAIGITRFNTSPVLTFNKPTEYCDGTETLTYDWNLAVSMHPRVPYKKDLAAVDGKANYAVIEALSKGLGVSKSRIKILAGHTCRIKRIEFAGSVTIEFAWNLWALIAFKKKCSKSKASSM